MTEFQAFDNAQLTPTSFSLRFFRITDAKSNLGEKCGCETASAHNSCTPGVPISHVGCLRSDVQ